MEHTRKQMTERQIRVDLIHCKPLLKKIVLNLDHLVTNRKCETITEVFLRPLDQFKKKTCHTLSRAWTTALIFIFSLDFATKVTEPQFQVSILNINSRKFDPNFCVGFSFLIA